MWTISLPWVAPSRNARSVQVVWSKRYTYVGSCALYASANAQVGAPNMTSEPNATKSRRRG